MYVCMYIYIYIFTLIMLIILLGSWLLLLVGLLEELGHWRHGVLAAHSTRLD